MLVAGLFGYVFLGSLLSCYTDYKMEKCGWGLKNTIYDLFFTSLFWPLLLPFGLGVVCFTLFYKYVLDKNSNKQQ